MTLKVWDKKISKTLGQKKLAKEQEKNGERVKRVERGTKHTIRDQKLKQKDMKNIFKV